MASLEEFDNEVKDLVTTGKLSSSKVKSVTDAAMANIAHDAHLVATLFKVHKQAKSSHKISSLYVIDAIAREAKQQAKKAGKGKQANSASNTPQQAPEDGTNNDSDDDGPGKRSTGTFASFLAKIESFLDRLVTEVLTKGPPEHKEKVKKVLDIWKKSATFSADALKPCYVRLSGEVVSADPRLKKATSHRTASGRSTTPPYPPPDVPRVYPPIPPPGVAQFPGSVPSAVQNTSTQQTSLAALLGSIGAAQNLGNPSPAPAQNASAPGFELSQLALLQQLAAQSSAPSAQATPQYPPLPAMPPQMPPAMPPSMMQNVPPPFGNNVSPIQPPVASSSKAFDQAPGYSSQTSSANNQAFGQDGRPSSPPARARDRPSRWDSNERNNNQRASDNRDDGYQDRAGRFENRDNRFDNRSGRFDNGYDDRRNRRSQSPPSNRYNQQRQRSPPYSRPSDSGFQGRQGANGRDNRYQSRPSEDRRIATFISDDREPDRQPKRGRDNGGRAAMAEQDLSSFEVTAAREPIPERPFPLTDARPANQQGNQNDLEVGGSSEPAGMSAAQDLMAKPAPFDGSQFNALDPASWASFAAMCQLNMGHMPSNMEMVQWIMSGMAMMQASAAQQMEGSGSGMGMGMGGMNLNQQQGMGGMHSNQMQMPNSGMQNNSGEGSSQYQDQQQDWNDWQGPDGQTSGNNQGASNQHATHLPTSNAGDKDKHRHHEDKEAVEVEGAGEADMEMTPDPE